MPPLTLQTAHVPDYNGKTMRTDTLLVSKVIFRSFTGLPDMYLISAQAPHMLSILTLHNKGGFVLNVPDLHQKNVLSLLRFLIFVWFVP